MGCDARTVVEASRTAILAAVTRAMHAIVDPDPIFEDEYALTLTDCSAGDFPQVMKQWPESVGQVLRLTIVQRARFAEDQVEQAVANGTTQYVDLGAGLNSFAWRRPDLMARLTLFEVDHPATQRWKLNRLRAIGLECPSTMRFAGVDFAAGDDLQARLIEVGFDPTRPTIWSWLGVIYYLSLEAVQATLAEVARLSAAGSELVASFVPPDRLMEPASRTALAISRRTTAGLGEPLISSFEPSELQLVTRTCGWPQARAIDPASFAQWFAGRSDSLRPVRFEWLLVAQK